MTEEIGRTIRDDEVPTGMHMDTGTVIIITDVTPEPTRAEVEAKKCIGVTGTKRITTSLNPGRQRAEVRQQINKMIVTISPR